MKHFDNDGVTVFGGIPFQSSYRHKLFGKIIKNVLASNAYGHPYAEGGCHYGDEKTKSSNDLSFK
nr:MAG TPA: hypothetical protein [Caudoviricetes sp.]